MSSGASPLAAFHLVGDRTALQPEESSTRELRPAVFGVYHDLSRLRFDFPVVLINQPENGIWAKSLADIIDDLLNKTAAPGPAGEETRRQVLSLEQIIRSMLADGQRGSLSLFWEGARRRLVEGDGEQQLDATLQRVRNALDVEGELVGCDKELAAKFLHCAWQESEKWKAVRLYTRISRVAQKLADILKVNYIQSPEARQAKFLESTMGSDNQSVFDFQAMARVLRTAPTADDLPANRRQRISEAIEVLQAQRFVTMPGEDHNGNYEFCFGNCDEALSAYRERLAAMAALVKAISIAELEIENRYIEEIHDDFFNRFSENRLGPGDLELFPSYLLSLEKVNEESQTEILNVLRSGLPFKIMAQTTDVLGDDSVAGARLSFGLLGQQLARMTMGLENVFVMQAANSSLYRLNDAIGRGLSSDRPALFSIFAAEPATPAVSPYLAAAAATESRAFPAFTYDPAAGKTMAECFDLIGNPEVSGDWPAHTLSLEDADHNSQSLNGCFTLIDFIASDPRFASRFVCIARQDWSGEMVPAVEFLRMNAAERSHKVPYVLLIDEHNVLHRAVFDDRLIDAAQRCIQAWHHLQELGGINNSHVTHALANMERQLQPAPASDPRPVEAKAAEPGATVAAEPAPAAAPEPETSSDDAWIETIRCTTCNECTQLNDRMFAYDEDQRAYIADPDAGTFRELVEAAETCQVAIIHPGKPRNTDEADLDELLLRAELFN
jgi:hypothetical protein